jgi:shikimate dehydrogenase
VAFALVTLGADELRIVDSDASKAEALAEALRQARANASSHTLEQLEHASQCDGLDNCTPLVMYQYPGNPIPPAFVRDQTWAFDAIYTPLETTFLCDAREKALQVISGLELMFYQALDAFKIWTGRESQEAPLWALLREALVDR